jgi:hypothetical protein
LKSSAPALIQKPGSETIVCPRAMRRSSVDGIRISISSASDMPDNRLPVFASQQIESHCPVDTIAVPSLIQTR